MEEKKLQRVSDRTVALVEFYIKLVRDPYVPEIARKAVIYLIRHTDNFSRSVFMKIPESRDIISNGITFGVHDMVSCNCNTRIDDIFKRLGITGFIRSFSNEFNGTVRFNENITGPHEGTEIPFDREAIEKIRLDGSFDLDELQGVVEKLLSLLRDRETGLMSWHDCMRDRVLELVQLLF